MKELNFKDLLNPKHLVIYCTLVANPSEIANKVSKNRASWKEASAIYTSLFLLSMLIYGLVFSKYTTHQLKTLDIAVFQFIYIFIAAGIIKFSWRIVGGNASFILNFKLSMYLLGMLYVFNSILFPFSILQDAGGNRFIVFVPAFLVILWTLRAWSAYGEMNQCNLLWKKSIAFLIAAVLFISSGVLLGVLTGYFVHLT